MDRRKFCLASVAAAISGAAAGFPAAAAPAVPLYRFIYDRRFSTGRAFGAAAKHVRSAAGAVSIDGDITELWSRDLRLRWSTGDGAVAGIATARTLFCLEQLAKDHWMRVLIRADHAVSGGQKNVHRLTGSLAMMAGITQVLSAGDWPTKMPAVLATCSIAQDAARAGAAARVNCVYGSPLEYRSRATDEPLVSFVIA